MSPSGDPRAPSPSGRPRATDPSSQRRGETGLVMTATSFAAIALFAALGHHAIYGEAAARAGYLLDDAPAIVDNPVAKWPPDPVALMTTPWFGPEGKWQRQGVSRPLTTLTYCVEDGVGNLSVAVRHQLQLLLAAVVATLFGWLVFRVARLWRVAPLTAATAGVLAAGLFATLPAHVEAVMVLSYRPEPLSALWLLLAAHALISDARAAAMAPWALLMALLAKESALAALAPLSLLALLVPGRSREEVRSLIGQLWLFGATWLAARALIIATPWVSQEDNPLWQAELGDRLRAGVYLIGHAAHRLVDAELLAPDYSFDALPLLNPASTVLVLGAVLAALCLVALVAALWWLMRDGLGAAGALAATSPGAATLALGLLTLSSMWAPVSQLLVPATLVTADRLLFSPSLGLCALVAALAATPLSNAESAWRARRLTSAFGGERPRLVAPALLALLALAAAIGLCVHQAAAARPVAQAHEAELGLLERGARLQPRSVKVRYNLARLAHQRPEGRAEARQHAEAALAISPNDPLTLALMLTMLPTDAAGCSRASAMRARIWALRPAAAVREAVLRSAVACDAGREALERVRQLATPLPVELELVTVGAARAGLSGDAAALLRACGVDPDGPTQVAIAVEGDVLGGHLQTAIARLHRLGDRGGFAGRRHLRALCERLAAARTPGAVAPAADLPEACTR